MRDRKHIDVVLMTQQFQRLHTITQDLKIAKFKKPEVCKILKTKQCLFPESWSWPHCVALVHLKKYEKELEIT